MRRHVEKSARLRSKLVDNRKSIAVVVVFMLGNRGKKVATILEPTKIRRRGRSDLPK